MPKCDFNKSCFAAFAFKTLGLLTKAATRSVLQKKVFLKIQILQENACDEVSF